MEIIPKSTLPSGERAECGTRCLARLISDVSGTAVFEHAVALLILVMISFGVAGLLSRKTSGTMTSVVQLIEQAASKTVPDRRQPSDSEGIKRRP